MADKEKVIGNYIAGQWRTDGGGEVCNINPSQPDDVIGVYRQADDAQLQSALAAARKGFGEWSAAGLEKRQAVLTAIGNEMMARAAELGGIIAREEGKPRAEGIGEAYRAGQFFNYFAAEVLRPAGESVDSVRDGVEIEVRREALGVVAVISPWNFPMAAASWKIAPALAFGNAVIWKPATLTPASAVALTEIIAKQDIPAGVFNLLMGGGGTIGAKLAAAKETDAISFTGSFAAGREVAIAAAQQMTRLQAEMGSKNPLIIMDDADMGDGGAMCGGGCFWRQRAKMHRIIAHYCAQKNIRRIRRKVDSQNQNFTRGECIDRRHGNRPGCQRGANGIQCCISETCRQRRREVINRRRSFGRAGFLYASGIIGRR